LSASALALADWSARGRQDRGSPLTRGGCSAADATELCEALDTSIFVVNVVVVVYVAPSAVVHVFDAAILALYPRRRRSSSSGSAL
jgi:hypothetical protein